MDVPRNKSNRLLRPSRWAFVLIFLTGTLFVAPSSALGSAPLCQRIFADAVGEQTKDQTTIPLLKMNALYHGEDRGLYRDPISNAPWNVKYFTEKELTQFVLRHENGFFVNHEGKRVDSNFDSEALSFETSLIVIDKNERILLMPFEVRGLYHHSSLSQGKDVLFAGTAAFVNGKLREFTNDSGHYKPSALQTLKVIRWFYRSGVDLSQMKIRGRASLDLAGKHSLTFSDLKNMAPLVVMERSLTNDDFQRLLPGIN